TRRNLRRRDPPRCRRRVGARCIPRPVSAATSHESSYAPRRVFSSDRARRSVLPNVKGDCPVKADFSRDTFRPLKHYSRVLQQQGRVQVDADFNEQVSILLHHMRTTAADIIGPYGGPVSDYGFQISPAKAGTFIIGAGRYYVGGILCENDEEVLYSN